MDMDDQDVERACKRIRLQSPEPDVAYDNFEDFLLSDSELFPQLMHDNDFSVEFLEPTEDNKDEARLDILGEGLVAETVRHVCLGTINMNITSSFFKNRQESEVTVNLRQCGSIMKLTTADTGAYAGIVTDLFPLDLLHRPSMKLSALFTAPASLRVIILSHIDETAEIGTILSNNDLFLQHPSPREIEYFDLEMEYLNPHYLVTPGSRMPQLEDLAIEYNDRTSIASLALDDQKKDQLIGVFDTPADLSIRPTTDPSPRLQTRLKDYQLKALTVLSEKECVNVESPQCPSLWVARDATNGERRYGSQIRVAVYHGPARQSLAKQFRNNDIVLTTYQTLRSEWTNKGPLFTAQWFRVVLDEAHRIGNRSTQVFQAACELQSPRRWCLTGTPIVNTIDNYGALLAFIKMEPLDVKARFDHWISNPIRDNVQEGLRKLRILVEATYLRRTKSIVSQALPPPTVQEEKVDLHPYDRVLYNFFESEAAKNAADSYAIFPADASETEQTSNPSDSSILPIKSVVFSYWTRMLDIVQKALLQAGLLCERIDGKYSIKQREKALWRFSNDPYCTVMLATLGSGGEGIDLTSANHVHLLEPHWNPMAEEQAMARVHRIGQQRRVTCTKYITPDSIEEVSGVLLLILVKVLGSTQALTPSDTWSADNGTTGNGMDNEISMKLEQWLSQRIKT
ncbi:helicase-like transcription factor [Fusarium sp. NRRL 52700]|nr:helicase-like transcription factor [Fusarium sp. NRRL 52700]